MSDAKNASWKIAQRGLIAEKLQMAFEPTTEGSAAGQGWACAANLVQFWLANPDKVPQPPAPPLRGLVFIEDDGTVRLPTARDA